ncbi:MAG: gliding motility-associated C-terminal domain-containing protein [Flavobacteriales bacterium]|nr:gliding motility-associated C-terminal domain-containing protein [Flavobacteriales bacterium]
MRATLSIFFLCLVGVGFAAAPVASFTENKGQWPVQVLYRVEFPGGALFVEREAFTYVLRSGGHQHGHGDGAQDAPARAHAYRVHFVGGHAQGSEGRLKQPHYENFFLGNDPTKWGTGCALFGEVLLTDIWPGIDLRFDGRSGLKYEFIVASGADPHLIKLRFEGHDGIVVKDDRLFVRTTAGEMIEEAPVSFYADGSAEEEVLSAFSLKDDLLAFDLHEGTDASRKLIIDPILTFGSYSGSTGDNFGFTATYDATGHLYGGGNVFDIGYPTTVGVLDPIFNGGTCDVGISKWSPDGTTLVWSTYLGGTGDDLPHSLVVNTNNELFVMGSTGSSDMPVTAGCFDPSFNSGTPNFVSSYNYPNGSDIYVAHFNAAATSLIGCTYVGGLGNDGLNTGPLNFNYGDQFRGEIALDANEKPVISTVTASIDMPTSPGAPQAANAGGAHDAYFFRMNAALTAMEWGTYHGGTEDDTGFGVQFDSAGNIFTTGGTQSSNLPTAGSPAAGSFFGSSDGYIARYSPDGSTLLSTTFAGTNNYDQSFLVQLDLQDNVYIVGQTHGAYPVTPGKYAVPNSSQFIHKFSNDLSTSLWSTRIGNGNGNEDISPSAFLVSDCGQIYFSGWGGGTNNVGVPINSTTNGLPTTPGAFQSTTDGSDFYLMVLEPDADALNYATFFGGAVSSEHVDGGTSRFDKNGTVYQAVCAGCGANSDFPTTPGAWSNTNNSFNCNLGVFKFDLAAPNVQIGIAGPNTICFPSDVQFTNTSTGGNTFLWNFGDGGTSTEYLPTHTYTEEGTFTVTLVMSDSYGCSPSDSASITIVSNSGPVANVDPAPIICPGGSTQLNASGGDTYSWSPPTGLSDPTIADPFAAPATTTNYTVVASGICGTDTASVNVIVDIPAGTAMPDPTICIGDAIELSLLSGTVQSWEPDPTLSSTTSQTPTATPLDTTTYYVTIVSDQGCIVTDSITIYVIDGLPEPALVDTAICTGSSVLLTGPVADSWSWQASADLTALNAQSTTATPGIETTYYVVATNVCGSITDSVRVSLITVQPAAWPDTIVCPGMEVQLFANGGVEYSWSPPETLNYPDTASPVAVVWGPITYSIEVTDEYGCIGNTTLSLTTWPLPNVLADPDQIIEWGHTAQLGAVGDGLLVWETVETLSCDTCDSPIAKPDSSTTYTVTVTDVNGCKNTDVVTILLDGSLYVPNTFTPNGDGVNDVFRAWGKEIKTYKLYVFNRWGEQIFSTESLTGFWDGTYKGVDSPIDTYVWKIHVSEITGNRRTLYGHVNLVR